MTNFTDLTWLNPPLASELRGEDLLVRTRNATDFWHKTFYGFQRHSGHFLHQTVTGDFSAEVTVLGQFEHLYDQAGLMARLDDTHWVKTGIELTDGAIHLSVVITNGQSDWSLFQCPVKPEGIRIRLTRHAESIRVQYVDSDGRWKIARLGFLPPREAIEVGVMCCSPEREGFEVLFKNLTIGTAIARQLHD
jgi:uncharacterized protein